MFLLLPQDSTATRLTLTLRERTTLENPAYLIVFESETPGFRVAFLLPADESSYPERANQFTINVAELFAGAPAGRYLYTVYEQSGSSLDETGLTEVENGLARLAGPESEPARYQPTTTYRPYAG